MAGDPMYHDGMRQLQDVRETRRLADRLEQVPFARRLLTDRAFIQRCLMFFIATADARNILTAPNAGCPGSCTSWMITPCYSRLRRQWHVLNVGNVLLNPHVGLLS
jgi:hypothetical protein